MANGQAEKKRIQKQKEIVEDHSAPIESVEELIPQKSDDIDFIWKPTGRTCNVI